MNAQISSATFDTFFAWAPWVIGILIYTTFFVAKRHERGGGALTAAGQTYACAQCGRRGSSEQMLAQEHGGAVSWYCTHCAAVQT